MAVKGTVFANWSVLVSTIDISAMRKFLLLCLLFTAFAGSAQIDQGNRALNISPMDLPPMPDIKPDPTPDSPEKDPRFVPPSIHGEPSNRRGIVIENKMQFPSSPKKFVNPGKEIEDKLNKRGDGELYKVLRKNQYLGDFKTTAKKVHVSYRDHEYVDGDRIRVWVNDRIVKDMIYLNSSFQGFDLDLDPGFNKIDFEALNQGTSGPNTAEFRVVDDQGNLVSSNRWDLATGFKATIIIVKEE